ncbi:hypothetical protein Bca4012_070533 [Brassica carinata]
MSCLDETNRVEGEERRVSPCLFSFSLLERKARVCCVRGDYTSDAESCRFSRSNRRRRVFSTTSGEYRVDRRFNFVDFGPNRLVTFDINLGFSSFGCKSITGFRLIDVNRHARLIYGLF